MPFPQSCDKRIIYTEECEKCPWRHREFQEIDNKIKPCPFCGGRILVSTEFHIRNFMLNVKIATQEQKIMLDMMNSLPRNTQ